MGREEKLSELLRIVMVAIALSLLAIKINIVLEINQLTEKKAPVASKLFQKFNLYFEIKGIQKEKEIKLRGGREIAKKKKSGKKMVSK